MKIFFTLFFYLISIFSFSQIIKNIYVFDSISKTPVSFTNVLIYEKEKITNGFYADENGLVKVMCNENSSLNFSCIGYENKAFEKLFELSDTIFLKQNSVILKEVIITNSNKYKKLGFNHSKKVSTINTNKGSEFAVFIENESNVKTKIKSVILNITKKKKYTIILKIKFYKKGTDDTPTVILNTRDIIYYLKNNHNGELEIDIDDENIELPEDGIFLSVESLGFVDENGSFINDKDMWHEFSFQLVDDVKNSTFTKNNLKASTWYNNLKIRFEEIGQKYKNYPNAYFGIKVYTE